MGQLSSLPDLVHLIAMAKDPAHALQRLAEGALAATASKVAMIAVVNDELGCLEIQFGAGEHFESRAKGTQLQLESEGKEGIVSYVAATGARFSSGNVQDDPRYRELFAMTASEIAVPIRDRGGRIRGVFNLESDRPNAYDDDSRLLLGAVADLAATALLRQDAARREEALIEIGSVIESAQTERSLLDRVIQVAGEVLRFQACSIFLLDPESGLFRLRASVGWRRDVMEEIAYAPGQGFTGWVCERGEAILSNDPQSDPRWHAKHVELPSEQIASFLAVPIFSKARSIGAVRVLRRVADNPFLDNGFTESDLRILQAIAREISTGLENIRHFEKALRSERMIAWGELSAKSSHMIGNRVFALKGDVNELAYLLDDPATDSALLKDLQKSLSTNILRIDEILQDFRDFLTATQLVKEPTDLNALVRETAEEIFPKRSPCKLELALDLEMPSVPTDPKKLRRALSELIENSLNYMEEGALRVRTRWSRTHPRRSLTEGYALIEVQDMGPGVPEEQKERIFQPFFSNRVKGMGLGLSIVKGIVDAHGGEVYEAGEEGKGACFVILLPAPAVSKSTG